MIKHKTIETVLGKTFADSLNEPVIDLGPAMRYTKREMVEEIGCANFLAARRLESALKKLDVRTPKRLHDLDPMSLARIRGIGHTSLLVAMCILEVSEFDVEAWWGWKQQDNVVKFSTFKAKALSRAKKRSA